MLRWILCAALVMAAAASAVPAGAQPSSPDLAEAASLYRSAEQAMADKRYDEAARDYGAAYEISKDAILFFKIASALDKGGKCPVAITYYRRYLREGKPSADHQKLTGERIAACEGKASSAPPPSPPPAAPPSTAPSNDKAPPAGDKPPPSPATPSAPADKDKGKDKDKAKSPPPPSTSGEAKAPATPAKPGDKPADTKTGTTTGTTTGDKPADKAGDKPAAKKAGGSTGAAGATSEATPSPTAPAASELAAAPTSSDAPVAATNELTNELTNEQTTKPTSEPIAEPTNELTNEPIAEPTSELANVEPPPSDANPDANPDANAAFTAPIDTAAPSYPPPSLRRTGAWLAVGAGIAFATVGTVLALSAESTEDDIADLYLTRAGEDPQEFDRATQDRYDTLVERGDRYQLLSWVSFGAAAATAGVATYFFLTSSSTERADEPKTLALRPLLSHQGAGVNASWAF